MVPVTYNVRSLLVRKVTTFAAAGGIALVVFVFAAALMLGEGVSRALGQSGRPDTVIILRKGSDAELSSAIANDYVNLMRGHPEVAQGEANVVGEVIVVITAERTGGGGISNVLVRGMPADGIKFRPEMQIISGRLPKPGTNEVIVGKAINGRFEHVELGQTFELRRNRPLVAVGVFSTDGTAYESEVWGDLEVIRRALGRDNVVSSVRVRLANASMFDAYRASVEADKRMSMKVMREADYYKKQSEQTSGFLQMMGISVAIMFAIAAMIGAAITMNGAVAHRTREIGTLRALGFSQLSILGSFLLEAVVLSLIGGAIGTALVLLLSLVSFPVMNFQTFSEIVISFVATPAVIIKALTFSMVMGLVGGLVPAIRASLVSPVEAMRA